MKLKVQKIGNSLMCTLPISVAEYLEVSKGDEIDMRISKEVGVIINKA